jgi:hypothetical protein
VDGAGGRLIPGQYTKVNIFRHEAFSPLVFFGGHGP